MAAMTSEEAGAVVDRTVEHVNELIKQLGGQFAEASQAKQREAAIAMAAGLLESAKKLLLFAGGPQLHATTLYRAADRAALLAAPPVSIPGGGR